MNRSEELQARRDKVEKDRIEKLEEITREEKILSLLPESVALPRYCHTGSKLYGTQASLSYGESYSMGTDKYSLSDALALVDSISSDSVDLFTVKDSCLSIKPEHAITENESKREYKGSATINGPFYGAKIRREYDGAKLIAVVILKGEQIEISVELNHPHDFGGWRIESTGRHGTRDYRGNNPEYEGQYIKQPAAVGQAQTVKYSGGGYSGRGSAGQMVYLFDCREALDGYADTLTRRKAEQAERMAAL